MASQARHGFSPLSRSLNYFLFGIFAFLPDCWNLPEGGAQVIISLSTLHAHSPVATQRDAQQDWPQTYCVLSSHSFTKPFLTCPFIPSSSDPDQHQRPHVTLKEVGAHRGSALPSVTLAELWVQSRALALPLLFPLRLPGVPDRGWAGFAGSLSLPSYHLYFIPLGKVQTNLFLVRVRLCPGSFCSVTSVTAELVGRGPHQSPAAAPQPQSSLQGVLS